MSYVSESDYQVFLRIKEMPEGRAKEQAMAEFGFYYGYQVRANCEKRYNNPWGYQEAQRYERGY